MKTIEISHTPTPLPLLTGAGANFLPVLEAVAIRTDMEGLEVGLDWLAFVGYEKHGDYEFTGSLPDFSAIQ